MTLRLRMLEEPSRPRSRAACLGGARPCPWVSCRYHLAVELVRTSAHEQRRPLEALPETCALDVADGGGRSSDEVAALMGVSRQLIDLITSAALSKLSAIADVRDLLDRWREPDAFATPSQADGVARAMARTGGG